MSDNKRRWYIYPSTFSFTSNFPLHTIKVVTLYMYIHVLGHYFCNLIYKTSLEKVQTVIAILGYCSYFCVVSNLDWWFQMMCHGFYWNCGTRVNNIMTQRITRCQMLYDQQIPKFHNDFSMIWIEKFLISYVWKSPSMKIVWLYDCMIKLVYNWLNDWMIFHDFWLFLVYLQKAAAS